MPTRSFLTLLALVASAIITGCTPDIIVEVIVPDDVEDPDGPIDAPSLEIMYLGPDPGTGLEPGECGEVMELEVTANGTFDFHQTAYTLLGNGVAGGSIFSSATLAVDSITHETLVDLLPNPGGDNYIYQEPFTLTNEVAVLTYSACIHTEAWVDTPAQIQAAIDYVLWGVTNDGDTWEFDEPFGYAHRVNIWGGEPVEEYDIGEFYYGFTTAWSSAGHFNAASPGVNNLGAYSTYFTGTGSALFQIVNLDLEIAVDPDEWSVYTSGCVTHEDVVYCASDFVENCWLQNYNSGTLYAEAAPTLDGDLAFPVDFTYTEPDPSRSFNVYCEFNENLPEVEVAIAVSRDLFWDPMHVELGIPVPTTFTGHNGSDFTPVVAAHLYPEGPAAP